MAAMEGLQTQLSRLQKDGSLSQSIDDVDKVLEQLCAARENIAADPNTASITLAKLQNPVQQGLGRVTEDLKKTYAAQNRYGKALDKNFSQKSLPSGGFMAEHDVLASHPTLVNRAIAMHLLREGQFNVAARFIGEAHANPPEAKATTPGTPSAYVGDEEEFASLMPQELQLKFSSMYTIREQLLAKNLLPAIDWARANSQELEKRGSNLEFELTKLQYIWLFQGPKLNGLPDDRWNGLQGAMQYARQNFGRFQSRYLRDIQQLSAAMAFGSNLRDSPYRGIFKMESVWEDVSTSFTREFCSLLGLSAESPLYVAVTAGAIALPTLIKLANIMREKRTEWTTQHELPVEINLPSAMNFHAIFVCPVSKEQSTEDNPPMMMPCGHVVAKESLLRLSKGLRFKCPYCPSESWPKDAREIYL